jgi:phage baseplate assembly protein gpV
MADLRQGQASERDVNSATARVSMDDLGKTVSGKLQVLFPAAGGWNFFWTPKEGDHVVISKLPNGAQEGYVLGKVYTGNKMPQNGAPNIILIVSDDGKNVIRFDADNGTLDLVVDQDVSVKCKNVNVEVSETATVKAKNANITIEENASVEVKDTANIKTKKAKVEASESAEVKSPKVKIDSADVTITGGTLTTNGSVSPTGSGPYCAMVACACTGAPQVGNKVAGT